jgi:hypothetical protein
MILCYFEYCTWFSVVLDGAKSNCCSNVRAFSLKWDAWGYFHTVDTGLSVFMSKHACHDEHSMKVSLCPSLMLLLGVRIVFRVRYIIHLHIIVLEYGGFLMKLLKVATWQLIRDINWYNKYAFLKVSQLECIFMLKSCFCWKIYTLDLYTRISSHIASFIHVKLQELKLTTNQSI